MHEHPDASFELATLEGRPLFLGALMLVVAPWLILAGSIAAQGVAAWQARGVGEVVGPLVCTALWAVIALASRRSRATLAGGVLTVRSTFYRCDVPLEALDLAHARVFDREERTELGTARKRNGVGIPGFHSGHFKLKNGERAFVAVASGRWRLWLPRRTGGGLLLEPRQARALLDALRTAAQAHPTHLAGTAGTR
jgi:hypothetical protein